MDSTQADRCRLILAIGALYCSHSLIAASDPAPAMTADQLLVRVAEADQTRAAALTRYTGIRRYSLANGRFRKRAEVVARITYSRPGNKAFEVLSESGSGTLRHRVLKRLMQAESDASRQCETGRIVAANYTVQLLGTELVNGRRSYLVELIPKQSSPYLIRGRAWIDAEDFAIARVEGVLSKRPSIWTGTPKVSYEYWKVGNFWFPVISRSTAEAPVFGRTDLVIEYAEYRVEAEGHTGRLIDAASPQASKAAQ